MLTLVSKDSVKISDHFDVLCVLIACMVLEIINQMSKNQKSSLIVWNTVTITYNLSQSLSAQYRIISGRWISRALLWHYGMEKCLCMHITLCRNSFSCNHISFTGH